MFFPRILEKLPPLPRQHSAAIACTKNYRPIGVTVHSHCVESFEKTYSDVGEGGVAVNCEKKTIIFPEHPVERGYCTIRACGGVFQERLYLLL